MPDFVGPELVDRVVKLAAAFVLALPVAWNRERRTRILGLRTLPLVAVASCGYVLVALPLAEGDPNASTRIISGLMTGIGFVGGGAILKQGDAVQGTATAAAVWTTGALGAAVGHDAWGIAVALSVITLATFLFLTPLRDRVQDGTGREPPED